MISTITESRNWTIKTDVEHGISRIDQNLSEILFPGERGTFIWREHSEGVVTA